MATNFNLGKYDPARIETTWRDHWVEHGVFNWDAEEADPRASYVIDTPPPTVSGVLHIGHLFSYTQTDYQARYFRMRGRNVFYPMGFDDNGLPTERLVEQTHNVRASDMTRAEFVALCQQVVQAHESEFRALFQRLGLSVDWTQEYQTISPHAWKISQLSLLDLFEKGSLYRAPQPSLWDPVDRTALAQAEVEDEPREVVLYHLRFELEDGEGIPIATTRPELIPACTAIMVHPDDPRLGRLREQAVYTPLIGARVPVVADEAVDMEKGSGLVMCCTFGDTTDIDWWRRHKLPLRMIVQRDGRLGNMEELGTADWPVRDREQARRVAAALTGYNVREARKHIVPMLREAGVIEKEEHTDQVIPTAERSGAPIEILVTDQWMVRLLDKKDLLIDMGRRITWHPEFMRQRYEDWVTNLNWDWCISRQRYFGVPLPFWYSKRPGEEGRIIPARAEDLPVNPLEQTPPGYAPEEVEPDPDVLDTWATSSMSPMINSHGISPEICLDPARHRKLFPADLRPQAHEIIRTWAFYTIAKSALHVGQPPFRNAAISGWALASDHSKMSKSKGNVVEPKDILERYGADVARYWSAHGRLGRDTAFSEDVLKIGKRLATKLWNASKLAGQHIHAHRPAHASAAAAFQAGRIGEVFDLWILDHLAQTIEQATAHFEDYNYTDALRVAEDFFWKQYCDNYLELIKGRLYGDITPGAGTAEGVRDTLYFAHRAVLAMFAPVMPFITEEIHTHIYAGHPAAAASIHGRGQWPEAADFPRARRERDVGDLGVDILTAVRKYKAAHNLSMKSPVEEIRVAVTQADHKETLQALTHAQADLARTIHFNALTLSPDGLDGGDVFEGLAGLTRVEVRAGD